MPAIAVFDLNQTLYSKASKEEFFKFICFRESGKLKNAAENLFWQTLNKTGLLSDTFYKENFFNYLDGIHPDKVAEYATEFWSIEHPRYFNPAVLAEVKRLQDAGTPCAICSGALAVYMRPLSAFLKMDSYIASKTVYKNGTYKIVGESCDGAHKLVMLREIYGEDLQIIEAYSDEAEPMLDAAEQAFFVKDGVISPYRKAGEE